MDAASELARSTGSCPMCGRHDAVRRLHVLDHERRRYRTEPPLVTRYGLMVRGAALLAAVPRSQTRVPPPRRPSLVGAYLGVHGLQVPLLVAALGLGLALLAEATIVLQFGVSVTLAFLAGLLGGPLQRRGARIWNQRNLEWEQAMTAWRSLRYCSRCDHVFPRDGGTRA